MYTKVHGLCLRKMPSVARILIGLKNKNLESDIVVNAERSETKKNEPQTLLTSRTSQPNVGKDSLSMNWQSEHIDLLSPPTV